MSGFQGASSMHLHFFGRTGIVVGGPYRAKAEYFREFWGIKLAPEVSDNANVAIRIKDFGVPEDPENFLREAEDAVVRVLRGDRVYVGCGAGQGRTGMFLALMAKICGRPFPIEYVRAKYNDKAVETSEQEKFIWRTGVFMSRMRVRFRLLFNL